MYLDPNFGFYQNLDRCQQLIQKGEGSGNVEKLFRNDLAEKLKRELSIKLL